MWNEAFFTQAFQQVHKEVRTEDRKWHEVRKKTGIKLAHRVDRNVKLDLGRLSGAGLASAIPSGEPVAENSYFKDVLRMKRDSLGKCKIYFGRVEGW